MKTTEELTAHDRLLAETVLESLTGNIAEIREINLKILAGTETSDEALDAENFKQSEIETEVKSLVRSVQTWITEHTSDHDETSSLGSNHQDFARLP